MSNASNPMALVFEDGHPIDNPYAGGTVEFYRYWILQLEWTISMTPGHKMSTATLFPERAAEYDAMWDANDDASRGVIAGLNEIIAKLEGAQ